MVELWVAPHFTTIRFIDLKIVYLQSATPNESLFALLF